MTHLLAWCFGALLACAAGVAQAQLRLALDDSALDAEQRQASQSLLDEAMAALPPRFIEQLDREVRVSWRAGLPSEVYGQVGRFSGIELNAELLAKLVDGSAARNQTGRPHGTQRQELLATLLHELTHLYDRARLWPAAERRHINRCRQQARSLGLVGLPEDCRGQSERRFTLSDDPRLLDLAGWQQRVGQRGARDLDNGQVARSPDSYELTNALEFVAVNLEYFLLDPSYACRRPSLARYFREHFDWTPISEPCASDYPYLNAGRDFAVQPLGRLDPERVYEVDYLLA
ncbi:MAG: hypothetical protein B7X51_13600, partial [Pseudomonas sp. 34-62-33]